MTTPDLRIPAGPALFMTILTFSSPSSPAVARSLRRPLLVLALAVAVSNSFAAKPPAGSIRPAGKVAPADLPGLAKIRFPEAMAAALAKVPGSVLKAELEVEHGDLMYSFEIVGADHKVREVEIDAGNGRVLAVEDDENEQDDAKK